VLVGKLFGENTPRARDPRQAVRTSSTRPSGLTVATSFGRNSVTLSRWPQALSRKSRHRALPRSRQHMTHFWPRSRRTPLARPQEYVCGATSHATAIQSATYWHCKFTLTIVGFRYLARGNCVFIRNRDTLLRRKSRFKRLTGRGLAGGFSQHCIPRTRREFLGESPALARTVKRNANIWL